jgi:hypothetical protein
VDFNHTLQSETVRDADNMTKLSISEGPEIFPDGDGRKCCGRCPVGLVALDGGTGELLKVVSFEISAVKQTSSVI